MMALNVGTSLDGALAGVVAFSGAFLPAEGFAAGRCAKPPIALIHGEADQVVEPGLSRERMPPLGAAGLDASAPHVAGAGHGIAPDGLEFATAFLSRATGRR